MVDALGLRVQHHKLRILAIMVVNLNIVSMCAHAPLILRHLHITELS